MHMTTIMKLDRDDLIFLILKSLENQLILKSFLHKKVTRRFLDGNYNIIAYILLVSSYTTANITVMLF